MVAGFLATITYGIIALPTVVAGWSKWPPRFSLSSALLAPFGQIAVQHNSSASVAFLLTIIPMITLGMLITKSWVAQQVQRSLIWSIVIYFAAVIAAIFLSNS